MPGAYVMRHRWCILLLCLALWPGLRSAAALAQTPPSPETDRLATPGCFPRAESRELIAKQGHIALQLGGSSFDDVGRLLELDQGKAFYNFYLIVYRRDGELRLSIAKHDVPLQMDPTELCILVAGTRGALADARPGQPAAANVLSFAATAGLAQCRTLRPNLQATAEKRLIESQGRITSMADAKRRPPSEWNAMMTELSCGRGNDQTCRAHMEERRERAEAEARETEERQFELCSTVAAQFRRLGPTCRLVAQVLGRDFKGSEEEAGFSILLCDQERDASWRILKTFASGATVPWASGQPVIVNLKYYEEAGTPPTLPTPR